MGLGRPPGIGIGPGAAQALAHLRNEEVDDLDDHLLLHRAGEVRVDANLLHIRHDQQRRIVQRVGVFLDLGVGFDEVLVVALVFPGEAVLAPDVGIALRAVRLLHRLLEGVGSAFLVFVGGSGDFEQGAEVVEMRLRRLLFLQLAVAPFRDEVFRRHAACPLVGLSDESSNKSLA